MGKNSYHGPPLKIVDRAKAECEMRALRDQKMGYIEIGKRFGVSDATVRRILGVGQFARITPQPRTATSTAKLKDRPPEEHIE